MEQDEKALYLTEEEALGLLELALTSATEMNAEQRSALMKLTAFCREVWSRNTTRDGQQKLEKEPCSPYSSS
ncbi:hypothetical protein [Chthonomonas calidirosea]|uniref:Uncharacterized protein n=1 Tax=Chthonomonas calidirosea (strain DSM 23976 / ICMP 18418 / T49) TaxID=1303518 RepID=S0EYX0_CHTCT|nr:hypothetical protein [Chthonomonas calidirosea]CCW35776.1 hypothetical protein CCALI_01969 [Chthonomonas calidirosea T49]CEK18262.1 hypothetical protein CP488_02122 [Chthonomonas calidirosea]CEK19273.1 hypothetical protein CTKA_02126 [Chthonomonas calidirosea]